MYKKQRTECQDPHEYIDSKRSNFEDDAAIKRSREIFDNHMREGPWANDMPPMDVKRYYQVHPNMKPIDDDDIVK